MKLTLVICLSLFIHSTCISQIPGTKIDGPVKINDSITVKEGDTLKLGAGSAGHNGNFRYIYTPTNQWLGTPEESLDRTFSGKIAVVKTFKKWNHKKSGEKIYTVVNLGGLNTVVELESSIIAGEVVAINRKPVGPAAQKTIVVQTSQPVSVADELKKLKELLDQGILTKEEFDAQKKKLLEKQ